MVAFDFLPQDFGRWRGPTNHSFVILLMQVQWWGYHEAVWTLNSSGSSGWVGVV